ncbi:MAG: hypothetical protein J6K75_02150 [Erysipelotrichaceae bacterium]|nr:hypothetical protein [Erysipelotrichaceae bacterium]
MKQDIRIKKSKNAMKSALFQLMKKKLYSQITICELCTTAKLNRSTFYSNYDHIDDCLKEIHYDLFEAMISNNLNTNHTYDKKNVITGMLQYIQDHKEDINVLFYNDENNLLVKNMLNFFTQRFGSTEFRSPQNYSLIYHTAAFFTIINQWVRSHFPVSCDTLAELIFQQSEPYYHTNEFISQYEKNHV